MNQNNNTDFQNQFVGAIASLYSSLGQPTTPSLKSQITAYDLPPLSKPHERLEMSDIFITQNRTLIKDDRYNRNFPRVKI